MHRRLSFLALLVLLAGLVAGVHRSTLAADLPGLPFSVVEAQVSGYDDGDKIEVSIDGDSHEVNLIGADAPEVVDDNLGECFAFESAEYLQNLLKKGQTVYLQSDAKDHDGKHRLLRYVWAENSKGKAYLVNEWLIQKGYASFVSKDGNVKYDDRFSTAEKFAKKHKSGLWGSCDDPHSFNNMSVPKADRSTKATKSKAKPTSTPIDNFVSGGLGLSVSAWERMHGKPSSVYEPYEEYENDRYAISHVYGNIEFVSYDWSEEDAQTLSAARDFSKTIIPPDSELIETYDFQGGDIVVDHYFSASLAARFPPIPEPDGTTLDVWSGATPGEFVVDFSLRYIATTRSWASLRPLATIHEESSCAPESSPC